MGIWGKFRSLRLMSYSSEKRELPESISSIIMIEIFLGPFLSSRLITGSSSSEFLAYEGSEVRSCLLLIRFMLSVSRLSVLLMGSISFRICILSILIASAIDILLNLLIPKLLPLPSIPGTTIEFSLREFEDPELLPTLPPYFFSMLPFLDFLFEFILVKDNYWEQVEEAREVLDLLIERFIYFSSILKESTSFWLIDGLSIMLCRKLSILALRTALGIDSMPNYF
jgi:hypothetical protein